MRLKEKTYQEKFLSDIMKSKIFISSNVLVTHIRYRRAKNGSLCKAIPIRDYNIAAEINRIMFHDNKSKD
jgi:hypothetical protein